MPGLTTGLTGAQSDSLESIQKCATRMIFDTDYELSMISARIDLLHEPFIPNYVIEVQIAETWQLNSWPYA